MPFDPAQLTKARELCETLESLHREAADRIGAVVSALRELEESGSFATARAAARDAAKPFLSPEALSALEFGAAPPAKPKRPDKSPWFDRGEG